MFCLTVPKNAVGESFSLSLFSCIENIWMRGMGGECQDFPLKIFRFTVSKNFAGQPFRVSLISGIENFYVQRGDFTNFCGEFFESQYRNIS